MKKLKKKLFDFLKNIKNTSKNFLGICVGMRLLFEKSFEYEEVEGLGIFKGCVKDSGFDQNNNKIDIPNIGWCPLIFKESKEIHIKRHKWAIKYVFYSFISSGKL